MSDLVSILIPVYNTEPKYLEDAIISILDQTYKNFELIILDDGSTKIDITKIIEKFDDQRIILIINSENLGVAKSRNILIEKAKGVFLAFLDADDIAFPNRIATQVKFLTNNPHIGVVGSGYIEIPRNKIKRAIQGNDKLKIYNLLRGSCFYNPSIMLRKKIILDNNIKFNSIYKVAEDYAFWVELAKYTEFENISEPLIYYRKHHQNLTKESKILLKMNTAKILASQWLDFIDCANDSDEILVNYILGKQLNFNELINLENYLIKLHLELKNKSILNNDSNKYLARFLLKYILKNSSTECSLFFLKSKLIKLYQIRIKAYFIIMAQLIKTSFKRKVN